MPSITGGLNGAPAGRFQDVFGWVGGSTVECKGVGACHLVSQRGCKVQCRATGRPMNGSPTVQIHTVEDSFKGFMPTISRVA